MDRLLYVAMSGAKETLRAQTANNHNLANASTTGFRADLAAFQSRAVDGSGFASRVYAHQRHAPAGTRRRARCCTTGRDLDVAVKALAGSRCRAPDGREAYTRAGDLRVDPTGQLMTGTGRRCSAMAVRSRVPPNSSLFVARRRHDLDRAAGPGCRKPRATVGAPQARESGERSDRRAATTGCSA